MVLQRLSVVPLKSSFSIPHLKPPNAWTRPRDLKYFPIAVDNNKYDRLQELNSGRLTWKIPQNPQSRVIGEECSILPQMDSFDRLSKVKIKLLSKRYTEKNCNQVTKPKYIHVENNQG